MQHTLHFLQRMGEDFGRYNSAAGWEPPDPYKEQRERARAELAGLYRADTMLLTRPARDWRLPVRDRKVYSEELFGPLWRVGEVALLVGPRGVGKSILAVQIAESIARGRPLLGTRTLLSATNATRPKESRRPAEKVLYVDMQRSEAQWAGRYTLPSPILGKSPRRYRFSRDLLRAGIDLHLADHDAYRKDPHTYAQFAIGREIAGSGARIVIVDDILLGGANSASPSGLVRTMQTMRYWAMYHEISILVVASAKQCRRPAPVALADIAGSRQIAELADSVFALAPSTFGPQYRYVKLLASKSSPSYEGGVRLQPGGGSLVAHPDEVLAFQFGGLSSPRESAGASSPLIHHSSFDIHHSEGPFLAFQFLGHTDEHAHLVDYAADAHARRTSEASRLKRLRTGSVVDMLLSPEYARYIKGE